MTRRPDAMLTHARQAADQVCRRGVRQATTDGPSGSATARSSGLTSAMTVAMEGQQAAVAKLACVVREPGAVAVLGGPAGVGKTTLLVQLAEALGTEQGVRPAGAWLPSDTAADADLPAVVLADDAHLATVADLVRLLERCHARRPAAALVLAGEGRLLTLVARDSRLEQAVRLRTGLRPLALAETRRLVAASLPKGGVAGAAAPLADDVVRTIHEITAGIPAAIVRLVGLVGVVAAARPDGGLTPGDVELVHGRLSPLAA